MNPTAWFIVAVVAAALVYEIYALVTKRVPTFTSFFRSAHPLVIWVSGFLIGLLVGHFWW